MASAKATKNAIKAPATTVENEATIRDVFNRELKGFEFVHPSLTEQTVDKPLSKRSFVLQLDDLKLPSIESITVKFQYSRLVTCDDGYTSRVKTCKSLVHLLDKPNRLSFRDVVQALNLLVHDFQSFTEDFNNGMGFYSYWGQGNEQAFVCSIKRWNHEKKVLVVDVGGVWDNFPAVRKMRLPKKQPLRSSPAAVSATSKK